MDELAKALAVEPGTTNQGEIARMVEKAVQDAVRKAVKQEARRLPSGAQMKQLRMMARAGLIGSAQVQQALGVYQPPKFVEAFVPPTAVEEAEALNIVNGWRRDRGLPETVIARATRAASAAFNRTIEAETVRAEQVNKTPPLFGEETP
jgi:hypothetical protein